MKPLTPNRDHASSPSSVRTTGARSADEIEWRRGTMEFLGSCQASRGSDAK